MRAKHEWHRVEWTTLTSSRLYFDEVLEPNRRAYFDGPVTFASAFNFAASLFHFHEWLFADHKDQLINRFGLKPDGIKPRAFWLKVQEVNSSFGYIHDVANASKHVALTRPSTALNNISQTALQSVGYGKGAFGVGRYSRPNFVLLDGDKTISFDECATAMFAYWRGLLEELVRPPT
jgi:hypothetical protein